MRLATAVLAGVLALIVAPGGAQAATFVVTKVTDDNGPCDADCSLREAVIAANANAEQDVITLPAGTHELTLGTVDEDAAAGGDLDVAETVSPAFDIIVDGAGAASTTIDGNGIDRAFDVLDSAGFGGAGLVLRDVTITGGDPRAGTGKEGGAIVSTNGRLYVARAVFDGNVAEDAGAIASVGTEHPVLRVTDSTFTDNQGDRSAGAIRNAGDSRAVILNSVFSGNRALGTPFLGDGGAFDNRSEEGDAVIAGSVFTDNEAAEDGGAVYNQNHGHLSVVDSRLERNTAEQGGGLFAQNDSLTTVGRTTIAGNDVLRRGGGIALSNSAVVTLVDSTVAGNDATGTGAQDRGGGIYAAAPTTLTLIRSTVSGNTSATGGGGIGTNNSANGTRIDLVNSTLSGNTAATDGGGLFATSGSFVELDSSTIAANSAGGAGGGLFNGTGSAARFRISSTIVADNSAGAGADCSGGTLSLGFNLDSAADCGFTAAGDVSGGNAALAPLADNGGPTQTRAIGEASDALDAAGAVCARATDQRGVARPQRAACDIGAFEREPAAPPPAQPADGAQGTPSAPPPAPVVVQAGGPLLTAFGADLDVEVAALRRRLTRRGVTRATVENGNAFEVTGRLTLLTRRTTARARRAGRGRKVKIGAARFRVAADSDRTVRIRARRRVRRLLARRSTGIPVTAKLAVRDPYGNLRRASESFTLRPPRS